MHWAMYLIFPSLMASQASADITIGSAAIIQLCTIGSALQDKLPAALKACPKDAAVLASDTLWLKGKCPGFKGFLKFLKKKMTESSCLGKQLGWLKDDGSLDQLMITADTVMLSPNVTAAISADGLKACSIKGLNPLEARVKKCKKYKSPQKTKLIDAFGTILDKKCLIGTLLNACHGFIESTILHLIQTVLTGGILG
eukprot:TRINITY_DN36593_c0_g1_i1.p1 TRINITY_DN36593_c0_g1~~TRINITY_DN36593_c0_g1_i1.p1  ORF type:complete len:198 (-),score=56.16 TRINITY_DN36593_c0_g1_i1:108-701(-)